jgi:hypothetical protein
MSITIDALGDEIKKILDNYGTSIQEGTKKAVAKVAQETRKDIQDRASHLFHSHSSNPYAKSWKASKTYEDANGVVYTLHSSKYQIAHLLEKGHKVVVNGKVYGKTAPKPHIAPAEASAEERLEQAIKELVR